MAIDVKPFIELAERHGGAIGLKNSETFYMPGAILYLAGALDAAQKRLDEYKAEIERLRGIIRSGENIQQEWARAAIRVCCDSVPGEEHEKDCPFYQWEGGAQ